MVFIDVDSLVLGFLYKVLYFKGTPCSYLRRMPRLTQPCAPLDSEVVNFFTDPKARADKRLKKVGKRLKIYVLAKLIHGGNPFSKAKHNQTGKCSIFHRRETSIREFWHCSFVTKSWKLS